MMESPAETGVPPGAARPGMVIPIRVFSDSPRGTVVAMIVPFALSPGRAGAFLPAA